MSDELWQARVFSADGARGSSVAVVLPDGTTPPSLSGLAEDLDAETTAFLIPGPEGRWSLLPFARGQRGGGRVPSLLAAEAVLRARGLRSPATVFDLPGGAGSVRRDERSWAQLPGAPLRVREPGSPLAWILGRDAPRSTPGRVVETATARVYVQAMDDPASLALLDVPQSQAWAYLRHEGLSAICLYAWSTPSELTLRVFESVLGGCEASASPHALPALWEALAEGPRPAELRVQQGRGPARARGAFRLRQDAAAGLLIGGEVRLLSRGRLLARAPASRRAC